jgi:hypothetical protein
MVPVLVLAIIALVLIKTLMAVVAREDGTTVAPWSPDNEAIVADDLTTVELRATVNDDVRAFLLPAVPEPDAVEQPALPQPEGESPVSTSGRDRSRQDR